MDTSEFLFPRDLEITPTKFTKILIVGSCMSEILRDYYRWKHEGVHVDHVLFNTASDLQNPPSPISEYNFQIIQLPVRSAVSDAVLDIGKLRNPEFADVIVAQAANNIDAMLEAALKFNAEIGIMTFVTNFIIPQGHLSATIFEQNSRHDVTSIIRELNAYLAHRLRGMKNVYLIDIEMIASSVGKRFFLDDNIEFSTHGSIFHPAWEVLENDAHWTAPEPGRMEVVPPVGETYQSNAADFYDAVYRNITSIFRTVNQIDAVKMVIFDLDNTIWRGQIAEHYRSGGEWPHSSGWPTGVWEAIHHLRARGIIVAICSKNEHDEVVAGWLKVINPPWISMEDFPIHRINHQSKASNIESIMQDVSLTAKSVLFVDDHPFQRAEVAAAFPGIRTIGSDPFITRRILMWSPELQVFRLTKESEDRSTAILGQIVREKEKSTLSKTDFLKSLNSVVTFNFIKKTADEGFDRSLELLNKTNQFNTTGRRWTFQELSSYVSNGGVVAAFSVKDKFVSYGQMGVILYKDGNFDQFVMSCRILGMGIEVGAIHFIMQNFRWIFPVETFTAEFKDTDLNSACKGVYQRAGFDETNEGARSSYREENEKEDFSHLKFIDPHQERLIVRAPNP